MHIQKKNEVQYYQYVGGEPAGNYTLTFSLNPSGNISFTTSNIAVEAPLFIIESAINVAASGVVPGWSNGDITVNGCPVIGGCQIYLVYSGNSVKNTNHITVQVNDDYITGTGHFEKVTVTNGQTNRTTMFVLYLLGLINTLPPQGTIDNLSITYSRNNPIMPNHQTLQALAKQASIEDKCDKLYVELMKAFKLTKLL